MWRFARTSEKFSKSGIFSRTKNHFHQEIKTFTLMFSSRLFKSAEMQYLHIYSFAALPVLTVSQLASQDYKNGYFRGRYLIILRETISTNFVI